MASKRYIVTFEQPIAETEAQKVFGASKAQTRDAVELLALAEEPAERMLLSLGEIGIYMKTMSDDEAEQMRGHPRVAEVVEDFEVHALGGCDCGGGVGAPPPAGSGGGPRADAYQAGYRRAVADIYGAAWSGGGAADGAETFGFCPPGSRLVLRCEPIVPLPTPTPVPAPPVLPPPVLQPNPWNIDLVSAPAVWSRVTGRGVKVAVIDTGIDENHPDLSVSGGACFVPGRTSWDDDQGHGTHCAGIIGARNNPLGVVGVAPNSALHAVKVLAGNGSGQLSWILAGMGWCVRNGMEVASMSLGSDVSSPDTACVVAYQNAASQLLQAGCLVVAAAGNAGRTSTPWVGQPARCPAFMAVAAVDQQKGLASFSSRGPSSLGPLQGVEISAPGVSVRSTYMGGGYRELSGTSMACPHVSGAAALLKELHPTWSPDTIRSRLKVTADDLGFPGNDSEFGAGLLNCQRAVFG